MGKYPRLLFYLDTFFSERKYGNGIEKKNKNSN